MGEAAEPAEPPFSPLEVDMNLPSKKFDHTVKLVCKKVVPGWSSLPEEDLEVSKISGGITNILLLVKLVAPTGKHTERVTVRIFGPNTDVVIDRKREWQAIKLLSAAGFGAKLIGSFKNGVVQSFIHARTLQPQDMSKPEIVHLIARAVSRFHEVDIPGSREPQLWPTIDKYLKLAGSLRFEDPAKQASYEQIDLEEVKQEVVQVQEVSSSLDSPIVFAHNDLLSGNFMHDEESGQFYIIDYEYGAYSYRGYDLGNHFNEYAGFDCDYTLYPDREAQLMFFREYLCPGHPEEASESELEALYAETNCYALASHVYWAVWALVQARYSPIDFDYLGYFHLRYNEYKKRKNEFLTLAKEHRQLSLQS